MSKAAKQSIFILIFLLIVSLGAAGYAFMQKQQLEQAKAQLEGQLQKAAEKEKKYILDAKQLQDKLKATENDKLSLDKRVKSAEKQVEDLLAQVAELGQERDSLTAKVEAAGSEKTSMAAQIDALTQQLAESKNNKGMFSGSASSTVSNAPSGDPSSSTSASPAMAMSDSAPTTNNDQYWAGVLKDKAALEVQIENLNSQLSKNAMEVVELKQKNSELEIAIDDMRHDQDTVEQEIKYKTDMVNNLSLELARTKNDKKFVADRVEKLNQENETLRSDLKSLAASKSALEKSIVRLSEEKDKMAKELGQTENVIQSKIDEIWEIKESLDETIRSSQQKKSTPNQIELPPIHVTSGSGSEQNTSVPEGKTGYNAKVVSINDENNFVIVDIGGNAGVKLGESLGVYRDAKYIARLEVIQVRKDIAAADIKDQWSKIKVGDQIR